LRILEDSELPKEQKQALFKQLMEKTTVNESSGNNPVVYDGADQVYIDVSHQN
jgi:hypothetical protein